MLCESILGLKVEAVQGKQVSLEWTETSGGLWEWGLILDEPTSSLTANEGLFSLHYLDFQAEDRLTPR